MERSERALWQANCEALRALEMSQFNVSWTEQRDFLLGYVVYDLWLVICLTSLIFFQRGKEISFVRNTAELIEARCISSFKLNIFFMSSGFLMTRKKRLAVRDRYYDMETKIENILKLFFGQLQIICCKYTICFKFPNR